MYNVLLLTARAGARKIYRMYVSGAKKMKGRKFKGKAKQGQFQRNVMKTHKFNLPSVYPMRGGIRL